MWDGVEEDGIGHVLKELGMGRFTKHGINYVCDVGYSVCHMGVVFSGSPGTEEAGGMH